MKGSTSCHDMKRVTIFDQGTWWFGLLEWDSYIQNRKKNATAVNQEEVTWSGFYNQNQINSFIVM